MSTWRRVLTAIEPHPGEHFKDKAIAVGLAFLMWLAVNAEDAGLQIFQNVPVSVINLPANLAVAGDWQDTIEIRVSGSARDLRDLATGQLSPVIDLGGATQGPNLFSLFADDISTPRGVQVTQITPGQINIVLDDRIEKLVEVSAVVMGEPALGYEVVGKATVPEQVELSGPRSLLDMLQQVSTNTVDVGGREDSFTQTVTLVPGNQYIDLLRERTAELTIEIVEQAIAQQFDAVQVEVINTRYRVDVNPSELSVVLSGPPSLLAQLTAETLTMVIDATDLEPRSEDYRIQPQVRYDHPETFGSIEVLAITPQSAIDVHVYDSIGNRRP